ncbi:MAG: TetR/AcrR family transcriptional regulator [Oscillospiraceae bacterium]|nr:TetR/AcrR family transcriptional regulator [Oscillospiraceae bacterium]
MPHEDLRVIKTKRIIKNALIDLMSEKEVSRITITELSERALINRKTFYRHYETISDVVRELEHELISEFADTLRNSNTSCLDVAGVVADISNLIERRRDYFVKIMKLNPAIFSTGRIKDMLRRTVAVSLRNIGGIRDGETLAEISQFIVSGVLALYSEWFDNGCTGSLDRITETSQKLILNGLRSFVPDDKLSEIV